MISDNVKTNIVESDVLVLGGGVAGLMAALRTKSVSPEASVTIVDRGYIGKTGQSNFFSGYAAIYNPVWGDKFETWMEHIVKAGEYLNDRKWVEILMNDSMGVYNDFEAYGVPFFKNKDGSPRRTMFTFLEACQVQTPTRKVMGQFRKKAKELKVKTVDSVAVTDLIRQGGRIAGAVGFNRVSGDFYVFLAKATVAALGNALFKSFPYSHSTTGSGHAIGYRAGAELISMEADGKRADWVTNPDTIKFQAATADGKFVNQKGEAFINKYTNYFDGQIYGQRDMAIAFEVEKGNAPIYFDFGTLSAEQRRLLDEGYYEKVGQTAARQIQRSGIKPIGRVEYYVPYAGPGQNGGLKVNYECGTSLPGLYASGDTAGDNLLGASYAAGGLAFTHAALTGRRAGQFAAEYARSSKKPVAEESEINRLKTIAYNPINREGGFRPGWVLNRIQWLMEPFDVVSFKHDRSMQASLLMIEEIRDYFIPRLWVQDYHQLANAHDVRDMVVCAEAILRSSLFRTESRGGHLRANYPFRDDKNWLAWVVCKNDSGKMKVLKEPMPKEYWPDLSKPADERYTFKFLTD